MSKRVIRLGITGGIGSGKSFVSRALEERFGVPVYNCDQRARHITVSDEGVIRELSTLIPNAYDADGKLNKRAVSDFLFSSDEHARMVNGIIHPAVRRDMHEWISSHGEEKIVAVESAILFESGFAQDFDHVLFVDAPLDVRVKRVMKRDGVAEAEVERRIARQQSDEDLRRADSVIVNDGHADVPSQLSSLLSHLSPMA